jgi:hypothetical protein
MMHKFFNLFRGRSERRSDFSNFFRYASSEEKAKLLRQVAREANEEQRELVEEYKRSHQGAF